MITFLACATIMTSLVSDWQATSNLFARYGPQYEINPIIRQVGPDAYFGTLVVGTALACRDNRPAWQVIAVGVWALQTWAVSTHEPFGTAPPLRPLLLFVVRY